MGNEPWHCCKHIMLPFFIIYFCQWCAPDSLVNAVAAALPVLHPYLILWWALVLLYVPTGLKLMLLIPTGKYNGADPRVMKLQSGPIGSSAWQRQNQNAHENLNENLPVLLPRS